MGGCRAGSILWDQGRSEEQREPPHSPHATTTDVNECAEKQHNCTQGDLCINTFGGHRCVRPKCPPLRHNTSYVKTSAL